MSGFVVAVQIVLAILVMLGVLLQTPTATGLGGSIGGSGGADGGYRRRRGVEATLMRLTVALALAFVVVALASTIYSYRH